jgi:GAF domain-containing protein
MIELGSPQLSALRTALATGPTALFPELTQLFLTLTGVRTVTYLAVAPDRSVTHRIGTSDPVNFPLGGFDPIDDGPWCRRILGDKSPVIGNTPDEMARFIPETDALVQMGYGALICAPIVIAAETNGVVCLLGDAGFVTPTLLSDLDDLLPIAALIFTFPGISDR